MSEHALQFVPATPADASRVLAIVRNRAAWLASIGSKQWAVFLGPTAESFVWDLIDTGYTWLVTRDDQDVGTLRLQWADRMFWGATGEDDQAGYVHTLAVHGDFRGEQIGIEMLQWASGQIAAKGRPLLRVDCSAENPKLLAYYERLGFEKRQIVPVDAEPGYRAQLLERSVEKLWK